MFVPLGCVAWAVSNLVYVAQGLNTIHPASFKRLSTPPHAPELALLCMCFDIGFAKDKRVKLLVTLGDLKVAKITNKKRVDELALVFGGADQIPEMALQIYKRHLKKSEKTELRDDRHEFSTTVALGAEDKDETRQRWLTKSAKKAKNEESTTGQNDNGAHNHPTNPTHYKET